MATSFWYTHLRMADRHWQPTWQRSSEVVTSVLSSAGLETWGLFAGLFGLPSNELVLITHGDDPAASPEWAGLEGGVVVEQRLLVPTARPVEPVEALHRPGLYVLRTFEVTPEVVDEVVELSTGAWTTFETSEDYASEPVGLFTSALPDRPIDRMLLVTWYDGFGSWEVSRTPDAAARDRFVRRHQLTKGTNAVATSLVLES